MDIAEKVRILAVKSKTSVQQIAEKSGQSSANLYNKLSRNDFKLSELERIACAIGATLEVNFIMPDGSRV